MVELSFDLVYENEVSGIYKKYAYYMRVRINYELCINL